MSSALPPRGLSGLNHYPRIFRPSEEYPSLHSCWLGDSRRNATSPEVAAAQSGTSDSMLLTIPITTDPMTGSHDYNLKGKIMADVTTSSKNNGPDLNSKTLDKGPLKEAAADAVNLYGQVQKAAIAFEFATAGAKLAKDKAKSISG